ncbi:hypothetical protein FSP39_013967 [Pinctada imbricata]|uniref:Anaphase-promoting complex subunit CDC26 n=1 Tax=Pinctada imbricata TaxID=66713 RepID=A0AA89C6I5_PINIB|nr:hypothetical protein FSP39_013967 [Pinctada imbricata]
MLRRSPTRIELTLDDMQEYQEIIKDRENDPIKNKYQAVDTPSITPGVTPGPSGTLNPNDSMDTRTVQERIYGYDPKPLPDSARLQTSQILR